MSYPFLHESEMKAARAEHEAGDLLGEDGRAFQRKIDASLEKDPAYRRWARRRQKEKEKEAGS